MKEEKFIAVDEKTTFDGVKIQCKLVTNESVRPCTICLLAKKCTEKHLFRVMCFGKFRKDKKCVYFGKQDKYEHDRSLN